MHIGSVKVYVNVQKRYTNLRMYATSCCVSAVRPTITLILLSIVSKMGVKHHSYCSRTTETLENQLSYYVKPA